MEKLINESVLEAIIEAVRDKITGDLDRPFDGELAFFKKVGLTKEYKKYCEDEESQAEFKLKQATDRLGEIFDPINSQVCSKCTKGERGCCVDCWQRYGHFKFGKSREEGKKDIAKLAELYKFKIFDGFWSKEGCSLPREKRSVTCLEHRCSTVSELLKPGEEDEIYKLIKTIRNCRYIMKANII